jgi:hypothetical protein
MTDRVLILVMSALGILLAMNPSTSKIDSGLMKGPTWLLSGILSKLLK